MTWDRLDHRALSREQSRLLSEWVEREVKPFSNFWATRLGGRTIASPDDLRSLDVVTEAEIAGAGGPGNPELLVLPTEEGFKRNAGSRDLLTAAKEVGTGGAAGRRTALFRRYKPVHVHEAGVAHLLAVAYTRTDLDRLHLAGARLVEVLGLGADDSMISAVPAGPSLRFWGLYHAALAGRMTALHPRGAGQPPLRPVLRALAMLPATVLAVPVAEAAELLRELAARNTSIPTLRTVLTVGPPPAQPLRVALAQAAERLASGPVRIQAVWAPESARSLWGECRPASADPAEATYGLHTYPDMEVVEVRDLATGAMAAEGAPGELVLTSMGWRGTALLRLATGSWTGGLSTSTPCPACHRTVPRLAPAASEAAWQPRVRTTAGTGTRADLRGVYRVLTSETLERWDVRDWSLRAVGDRLVFAVSGPRDRQQVLPLVARLGEIVGAEVDAVVDPRLAAARPQIGTAGPPA
jgi:hypothetical protein